MEKSWLQILQVSLSVVIILIVGGGTLIEVNMIQNTGISY